MAEFAPFSRLIHARFAELSKHELFVVDSTPDAMWMEYLAAFPEGTNPIFRERTEHDCSCCRQFIKNIGNVVAVIDGELQSVWDIEGAEYPYDVVAATLAANVKALPIVSLFRVPEQRYGMPHNFELIDGESKKWHHLHGDIATQHFTKTPGQAKGHYDSSVQVFRRGLTELSTDALQTVLDLIDGNALYRGDEFQAAIFSFAAMQRTYLALSTERQRNLFAWEYAGNPASRFRNTAIGTLIQDLSEGVELERAVKSYESKVAPTNYKRPTALITPRMVEDAMATITELGLEPALERRFAKLSDVSVNNVLWVDNSVQGQMKDGIAGLLMQEAQAPVKIDPDKAEAITIDAFMADVLPLAKTINLLAKNAHLGNFVSLTAPVHDNVAPLFKWDNNFAWSYDGNITDSDMRKAVQARGGRVDGVFRFTHSWNHDKRNESLMDLHVFMPGSTIKADNPTNDAYGTGRRIGWNHRTDHLSGGVQDVDYTAQAPAGYIPVENITFPDLARMPEGTYICKIHNWSLRGQTHAGFKAEIEFAGQVFEYDYPQPLKHKEWVTVAEVTLKDDVFSIEHHLPTTTSTQEKWGVQTEQLVKVNTLMFSPNHWDDQRIGNKHWFFLLDGCKNPEPTRGIYNEFLDSRLEQHRKVFEVLGSKTKCPVADDQLSGLGFSSTRGDKVLVQVTGTKLRKLYNIQF